MITPLAHWHEWEDHGRNILSDAERAGPDDYQRRFTSIARRSGNTSRRDDDPHAACAWEPQDPETPL